MRPNAITTPAVLGVLLALGAASFAAPAPEPAAAAAAAEAAEAAAPAPEKKETAAKPEPKPAAEPKSPKSEPAEPTAEDLFSDGRDALLRGQYDKAIELLKKAADADKTKVSYRLHLARAYRFADREKDAEEVLETILKASPDHVEAGQMLAEIYSKGQRWEDVVRVLEPLLKYRHDYPIYHMLAEAEYNLEKRPEAKKHYKEAVKLNPNSAVDHYQLGNIYLSDNAFALAAQSYQTALRLGLDTPVLHYKLGSAYFNLRNYFGRITTTTVKSGEPGTISDHWYLIEPVPGNEDAFLAAPSQSAVYQVAKAVADGIEMRPDIQVLQASIYLNAGRFERAYEMFQKIGEVPEEDRALVHYYHAQAAFGTGRYKEYIELLKKAIELNPDAYKATLVDAYLKVADQFNQAGDLDKYIEYLKLAVDESPRTASLHLKLGYAFEEAQKYPEAVAQWRMTLDLEPEHPDRMKLLNLVQKYQKGTPTLKVPVEEKEPAAEGGPRKPARGQ